MRNIDDIPVARVTIKGSESDWCFDKETGEMWKKGEVKPTPTETSLPDNGITIVDGKVFLRE